MDKQRAHQERDSGRAADRVTPARRHAAQRAVTVWDVRHGDDLYVLSVSGRTVAWFRGTQARHEGHIRAGGVDKDVTFVEDMNAGADGCDALVVATEWEEFKKLDLDRARKALTHPIMFDGRNLFDPAEMERLGFIYKSIGR